MIGINMATSFNGQPVGLDDIMPLALYGYGNFTTLLVEPSGVKGLDLHLERLRNDAVKLFGAAPDDIQIRTYIKQTISGIELPVVVRITLFSKSFTMTHPPQHTQPDVLVTTRPAPILPLPAVSLQSVPYARQLAEVKTTNMAGAFYQRRQAQAAGFDDALFVTADLQIAEGPTWSFGAIDHGQVVFPDAPGLPSTTVHLLCKQLDKQNMSYRVGPINLTDSFSAAFIASATAGIRPVTAIDDRALPHDPLIDTLAQTYDQAPRQQL